MTFERQNEYLASIINELRKLPAETEWVEFKHNKSESEEIGEYISALANSAVLMGKVNAYMVWGIENKTHDIIGTNFRLDKSKVGNEELENCLLRLLTPKINFRFYELNIDGFPLVLLEIGAAFRHPVQFKGSEFIRVGSYKKRLKDFPEKERELWRAFDQTPFEREIAVSNIPSDEVLRVIDYPSYFSLLNIPLPEGRDGILSALETDDMILKNRDGRWDITNLGAILFAKQLTEFQNLKRKAVRVILYKGENRVETIREQVGAKGYASGYEGLILFPIYCLKMRLLVKRFGQKLRCSRTLLYVN